MAKSTIELLNKKYGNVIKPASSIKEREQTTYSISPRFDHGLSGGIPTRSWCIFAGKRKVGKSVAALCLAAKFQANNKQIFYNDIENRWKLLLAYGIHGLDPDNINLISSEEDAILSGEDHLLIQLKLMKDPANKGSLFIMDSTSALCPNNVITSDEVSGSRRSTTPKLLTDFLKQAAPYVQVHDLTVVCISHLITNTSGYGKLYGEDGGVYLQHQADVHIRCTNEPKIFKDKDGKEIGQIVTWDVITSALGPPREKVETTLRYGYGYDEVYEYADMAVEYGIIEQGGSWFTLPNGDKYQGMDNLVLSLRKNADSFQNISEEVKKINNEILGT